MSDAAAAVEEKVQRNSKMPSPITGCMLSLMHCKQMPLVIDNIKVTVLLGLLVVDHAVTSREVG